MHQPQPPASPGTPAQADIKVTIGKDGIEVTKPTGDADIASLQAQAQLLQARIERLSSEIEASKAEISAPGTIAVSVVKSRLAALEGRRIDAEEALQRVENQLAGIGVAPATIAEVGTSPMVPLDPNNVNLQESVAFISFAAIMFIGAPIAVAIARLIWKRTTSRAAPVAPTEDSRRLERLEQAVDTIAVELERMSEGQRYVTRLLAERAGRPVAEAIPAKAGDPVQR